MRASQDGADFQTLFLAEGRRYQLEESKIVESCRSMLVSQFNKSERSGSSTKLQLVQVR